MVFVILCIFFLENLLTSNEMIYPAYPTLSVPSLIAQDWRGNAAIISQYQPASPTGLE